MTRLPAWPFAALVRRELLRQLRKTRALLMLAAVAAAAILTAFALWPEDIFAARSARDMLAAISIVFLASAYAFVPGVAAVTLTTEREGQTFDLLKTTLISPAGIVAGKLLNVLGFLFLLLFGALPILGVVFFWVGIDWRQLTAVLVVIAASAFALAAAGILCSTFFRRSAAAIVLSYLFMIWLTGLPILVGFAILDEFDQFLPFRVSWRFAESIYWRASPLAAMVEGAFDPGKAWVVVPSAGYLLLFAAVCLWIARGLLLKPDKAPKTETRKPIDDPGVLDERRKKFPYYLIDPLRRKKYIEDGRNPVYVKELRWGLLRRATWGIRFFYIAAIAYLCLCAFCIAFGGTGSRSDARFVMTFLLIQIFVTVAAAPALLGTIMSREYESANLDLLRGTLLRPHQVVIGKVRAGLLYLSPLLLASAVAIVPFILALVIRGDGKNLSLLITGIGVFASCIVLSLGLSIFASVRTTRAAASITLSYFLSIMAYFGVLLSAYIGIILVTRVINSPVRANWLDKIMILSPISAFIYNSDRFIYKHGSYVNPFWAKSVFDYTAVGLGFIAASVLVFRRRMMKE